MKLHHETKVKCSDHVMFRELGSESVVLNLETGVYYGLNETGTRVWTLLDRPATLHELHSRLLAEFEVEPVALWKDLLALLEEMSRKDLVQVASAD